MFKLRYCLLLSLVLVTADIFARAGGGGSYKSSGSSSSSSRRSSSSSSGRSSYSGSSSSRSDSSRSSSSYRPSYSSPSSSSSTTSASSTSSSSPPDRSTPSRSLEPEEDEFDSIRLNRTYIYVNPRTIRVRDHLRFNLKGPQGKGLSHSLGKFLISANLSTVIHDHAQLQSINDFNNGSGDFDIALRAPRPGWHHVTLEGVWNIRPTPTLSGMAIEWVDACPVENCMARFVNFPAQTQMRSGEYSLLTDSSSADRLTTVQAHRLSNGRPYSHVGKLRLLIPGETFHQNAANAWGALAPVASLDTDLAISQDGVTTLIANYMHSGEKRAEAISMLSHRDSDQKYTVAGLHGITGGLLGYFSDDKSYLYLKPETPEYGFKLLDAIGAIGQEKQQVRLPIPSPISDLASYVDHLPDNKSEIISYHKSISIQLPKGVEATPVLIWCPPREYLGCRNVDFQSRKDGDKIILTPSEAQIGPDWRLHLDVTRGVFTRPNIGYRLWYSLVHYHRFGEYPYWITWFYITLILIGIIILIICIRYFSRTKRRRLQLEELTKAEDKIVRKLKEHDPDFDVVAFKRRAHVISEKIQHAWSAGDMRDCRRYLSQGVYNRFRIQLKIMRDLEKRQNATADFKVLNLALDKFGTSGPYDTLVVRLEASIRDTMVDATLSPDEAQRAAQKAPRTKFVEFYSFMRRSDAKTATGVAFDQCGRCGTPAPRQGEITKCKNCGAIFGSGAFDWVLAEITQEVEHGRRSTGRIKEAETSSDRIEDRASYLFFRQLFANLNGQSGLIRRDAADAYLAESHPRESLTDIAVGASDLTGFEKTKSGLEARVRIKWSAMAAGDWELRHRVSILTLSAEADIDESADFSDHGCNACGSPLPETDTTVCAYCQSPIEAKAKDWLLEAIETTVER